MTSPIRALIFDLDGVLVDTEPWWFAARAAVIDARGGRWTASDEAGIKGANSPEWATALAEHLGPGHDPAELESAVVAEMVDRYRREPPPIIEAGVRAVRRFAGGRPLAIASSAHEAVIEAALRALGLVGRFAVILSADAVGVGKPAPDVYLAAAAGLALAPASCLVVEDSPAGVRAARAAGMRVVLVPAASHPLDAGAQKQATLVLATLDDLDAAQLAALEAD